MTRIHWIALLAAAAFLAGCRGSATEDDGPPPAESGTAAAATPAGDSTAAVVGSAASAAAAGTAADAGAGAAPSPAAGPAESPPAAPAAEPANLAAAPAAEEPLTLDSDEAARLLGVEPDKPSSSGGGDGPLMLDSDEAARLLGGGADETPAPKAATGKEDKTEANARCFVCHGNFDGEELSVTHARNGVGCEDCHGASDAHCSDENNITPPEIMFPKEEIDPACRVCHDESKTADGHLICLHILTTDEKDKRCTDCHGKHAMPVRTVRWNKKTGELLRGGWMEEAEK
jgi:hypothetical protein